MFRRRLGRSEIQVSALGLGCWAIGGDAWGSVDDDESIRALHRGLELGINFLDTADVYGLGHSEEVLARALAGRRNQVIIASKFGNDFEPETGERLGPNGSPVYIRQACERSLRRLDTDYIDLYQFHVGNYDLERAGEVVETLEALVDEGKIRFYGWSTDDAERAAYFAKGEHCTAVQQRMNVFEGNMDTLEVCETENLASVNRGPLAMGLLTGKYTADSRLGADDIRGRDVEWVKYFQDGRPDPEWLAKIEKVRIVLTANGHSLTQGALAWLLARSGQTIPIPGFKTVRQVEENAMTLDLGPLSSEQMAEIDLLLAR